MFGKKKTPVLSPDFNRFTGTAGYITSAPLEQAVNASVALGRPLLVKGEPGTGKTVLAEHVAHALELPLLRWQVKSTSKASDGLYVSPVARGFSTWPTARPPRWSWCCSTGAAA